MDRLLRGVICSDHSENVKRVLLAKLAAAVSPGRRATNDEVKLVFQFGIELSLLSDSSDFEAYAVKVILGTWGKAAPAELESSITPQFMLDVVASNEVGLQCKVRAINAWLEALREISADLSVHFGVVRLLLAGLAAQDQGIPLDLCSEVTAVLHQFPACLPIGDALPRFVGSLIRSLSVATIEDVVCVESIAGILGTVWAGEPSLLSHSLNVVFDVISCASGNVSTPALASIVQFIPDSLVPSATEAVLSSPTVTDVCVGLALQRMIDWLEWPKAKSVDKWVLAFLKALGRAKKFSILIQVTKGRVEQLFKMMQTADTQDHTFPVLSYILLSYQHSPDCFHRIVDGIPEFVTAMRDSRNKNADFLTQFAQLVHCLVYLHSGYPDLYEPVLKSLDGLPRPSDDEIKTCIAQNAWTAETRLVDDEFSSSLLQSRSETGLTGLVNMGNTCYMNSVLQALFMEDEFYSAVLSQKSSTKRPILLHLQAVFAFLSLSKRAAYAPRKLFSMARPPWFRQGAQQDCSEFLRYLLDQLHEEEHALGGDSESLVKKNFVGMFQIACVCDSCGTQSSMEEPFTEMALAVPDRQQSQEAHVLPQLINNFLAVETLANDNQYYCEVCQQLRDGRRWVTIKDTPSCLLLSLKRFAYDVERKLRSKVFHDVICPLTLEVHVESGDVVQYVLSSVVVHSGTSSDCGHYYTYARHSVEALKAHVVGSADGDHQGHSSSGWFLFNDSHVTHSSFDSFSNLTKRFSKDTAYLLFYNKVSDGKSDICVRDIPIPKEFVELVTEDNIKHLEEQEAETKRLFAVRKNRWNDSSRRWWDYDSDPSGRGGPPGSCGLGGSGVGQQTNRFVF